jgi:mono/diheme cytochrome c family protein
VRSLAILVGAICGWLAFVDMAQSATPRSPRVNYMTNCQGCHLPNGQGMPGKVPAMKGFVTNFLTVPGGREFLVRVPGVANSTLSDADLAALMNWLIPEMVPPKPSSFKPYSAQEIGALRRNRLQDVHTARAALVAQMPSSITQPQQPNTNSVQ